MSSLIMNANPPPLPGLVGRFCKTIWYSLGGLSSFVRKISWIAATFVSVVAMWWMMLSNFGLRPFAFSCSILSWCSCFGG